MGRCREMAEFRPRQVTFGDEIENEQNFFIALTLYSPPPCD